MLDDDTYLVSDNSLNLVTLRKNNEGTTSEDRGHLEEAGLFHLGEFINRIRFIEQNKQKKQKRKTKITFF